MKIDNFTHIMCRNACCPVKWFGTVKSHMLTQLSLGKIIQILLPNVVLHLSMKSSSCEHYPGDISLFLLTRSKADLRSRSGNQQARLSGWQLEKDQGSGCHAVTYYAYMTTVGEFA